MNQDLTINLDLNVNVEYETYPAVQGRHDEEDQDVTVEIHRVSVYREPRTDIGETQMVPITWALSEEHFKKIEAQILEEL